MDILAIDVNTILSWLQQVIFAAVGLGLVIFFHEFGHFAVAKWCGVLVERFSIGFGPIIWSFKRGDTEYALSAIPFGGYVKMLGQDDLDPSQLTSEEIARDPKAYSNKGVFQRMGIISAGVIMNILTAVLFYAGAFRGGVETIPSMVGATSIGKPAWEKGLRLGDTITRINGRESRTFNDILRGTTLSRGEIEVEGFHLGGETFSYKITPDRAGLRRMIGVSHGDLFTLNVAEIGKEQKIVATPDSAAALAESGFKKDDLVVEVGGEKVDDYFQLLNLMARRRAEALDFVVQRGDEKVTIPVRAQKFRELGIVMDIEKVAAIQEGSPAAKGKLFVDDKITKVNGEDVGTQIDPFFLADYFEKLAGQEVEVQVSRLVPGNPERQQVTLKITPTNAPAWTETPFLDGSPLAIPSIGAAYHLTSQVLRVVPGSPAAKAGVQAAMPIKSIKIETTNPAFKPLNEQLGVTIEFTDTTKNVPLKNMAVALWALQEIPSPTVTLEFVGEKTKPITLQPVETSGEHYLPRRGVIFQHRSMVLIAETWGEALDMGLDYTWNTAIDIYLTLRNLFSGDLSPKNLHGPLGIAQAAFAISNEGLPKLLLFLGMISVNLAILNFLPIPVLDGGHMVFLCWEAITRRKPSRKVLEFAQTFGIVFVIGLMLFVIGLDIFVHKFKI